MNSTPDYAARAVLLKALADETRLRILSVLMERGETCVCEFLELAGGTPSNLSFHLRKLKSAGLILDRKVGKWMFYRPSAKGLRAVCKWLCPLFDADRIPTEPAAESLAALCETMAPPLGRDEVTLRTRKGKVIVTSCRRSVGDVVDE